jgi:bifunctional UDP-N-acetylglucosamine pyrophosphorylase / glucosamine-1-phosphate N-acetyltransferase
MEAAGVNDRAQLATAEAELRDRTNERWMRRGVTMLDPERTYIDATVELAPDVTLFPGTLLQGRTVIATGADIGPDTRLVDCVVGEEAIVEHTVGRQAEIGAQARVGPFAVLPPGTQVAPGTVTGPFFEAGYEEGT